MRNRRVLLVLFAPLFAMTAAGGVKVVATAIAESVKKEVKKKKVDKPRGPPAKALFGAAKTPAPMAARAIGFYARGCLAGGTALPIDGPAWQAMRLSRNRNWGHPALINLIEKLALEANEQDGWPGLLIGDIAQPRGGPMLTGHASHQVGLDADIWFTPMPNRRLSVEEREHLAAISMVAADRVSVDATVWTDAHVRLLRRAASYASIERIFVHPAVKKALCEATANEGERTWLHKVRPYWGHNFHFHVRMGCPNDSANCQSQPPLPSDDGCGQELTNWLALVKTPPQSASTGAARPALTLDQLPADCRGVLDTASEPPAATTAISSRGAEQP